MSKSINIRVSEDEHAKITEVSKKLNISVSKLIKLAMEGMFEELEDRGMLAVVSK